MHAAVGAAPAVFGPEHAAVQGDRPVDRLNDVAHRDLGWRTRERESTVRAPLRGHEAGVHQTLEDLGEEAFGDVLLGADVAQRGDLAHGPVRQIGHGANRVLAAACQLQSHSKITTQG